MQQEESFHYFGALPAQGELSMIQAITGGPSTRELMSSPSLIGCAAIPQELYTQDIKALLKAMDIRSEESD